MSVVEQAIEEFKKAKRAKHDADMAFRQAKSNLISVMKDHKVFSDDLVEATN